jgi:acetyl esterase/lipase
MKLSCIVFCAVVSILLSLAPRLSAAQARVDDNVVFGMYSGLALLMDVHYPEESNGHGIVFIYGSGFHTSTKWDATPLKDSGYKHNPLRALVDGGYTVFVINHRAAPTFRYPANIEDAQRAVRFVREHADDFGIDPNRIGAFGASSGGYLSNMLALMDGDGDYRDAGANETSAKVQAVVSLYSVTDFRSDWGGATQGSYLGAPYRGGEVEEFANLYEDASPAAYVSADDPPHLLIHGDADETVPHAQSTHLNELLKNSGVETRLITIPGGGHGASILAGDNPYAFHDATVEWFDQYLRRSH